MTINNTSYANPYQDIQNQKKETIVEKPEDSSNILLTKQVDKENINQYQPFNILQPNTLNPLSLSQSSEDNVNLYLRENNAMKAMNAYNAF